MSYCRKAANGYGKCVLSEVVGYRRQRRETSRPPYGMSWSLGIIPPPQTPTPSAKIRSPFIAQPQISHHSITHKRCVESGEKCECEALSEAYISSRVDHVNSVGFDNSAKLFHVNLPEGQTSRFAKQNTSLRRKPKLHSFRRNDITLKSEAFLP